MCLAQAPRRRRARRLPGEAPSRGGAGYTRASPRPARPLKGAARATAASPPRPASARCAPAGAAIRCQALGRCRCLRPPLVGEAVRVPARSESLHATRSRQAAAVQRPRVARRRRRARCAVGGARRRQPRRPTAHATTSESAVAAAQPALGERPTAPRRACDSCPRPSAAFGESVAGYEPCATPLLAQVRRHCTVGDGAPTMCGAASWSIGRACGVTAAAVRAPCLDSPPQRPVRQAVPRPDTPPTTRGGGGWVHRDFPLCGFLCRPLGGCRGRGLRQSLALDEYIHANVSRPAASTALARDVARRWAPHALTDPRRCPLDSAVDVAVPCPRPYTRVTTGGGWVLHRDFPPCGFLCRPLGGCRGRGRCQSLARDAHIHANVSRPAASTALARDAARRWVPCVLTVSPRVPPRLGRRSGRAPPPRP